MCVYNNPKISIIVPVYNTELYLRECLDSLINQTFKDIEIICINDGSTDKSEQIIKEYMEFDNRVILINQENQGLSAVRNKGMEIMRGDYFSFVDSDDWIELNTYEIMYKKMITEDIDVGMFPYIREYKNKSLKKEIFNKDEILFNQEQCKNLHRRYSGIINDELMRIENSDALSPVCMKLYKSSIQKENNILFIDTKIIGTYEDGIFNLAYFKYVKKALYVNFFGYHYRKVENTTLTSTYRKDLSDQRDNLYKIILDYIIKNKLSYEFYEGLDNRIVIDVIQLGFNILRKDCVSKEKISDLKELISNERYIYPIKKFKIQYLPIHWKIFFVCCKLRLYRCVYILLVIMNKLRKVI